MFLHEAAHAVAAVDRGIRFAWVSVLHPSQWSLNPEGTVAGGVDMGRPAVEWVPSDPRRAMEFVLAGMTAEEGALGHTLEHSWAGDLNLWRIGMGLVEADVLDDAKAALGAPMQTVRADTQRWAVIRFPAIRAVALR